MKTTGAVQSAFFIGKISPACRTQKALGRKVDAPAVSRQAGLFIYGGGGMTAKQKISDLHAKFYGGKKKTAMADVNKKLAKIGVQFVNNKKKETDREIALRVAPELKSVKTEPVAQEIPVLGKTTRAILMKKAQDKGVKYFRVLSKEELIKVLEMKKGGASDEQIGVITEAAKVRWQSGWTKNKKVSV